MPCASKSARGATPLALLTSARPAHATSVCANATRSTVVLIFLQVVSLLELDLRELGELAAAQLHHLVPQGLGQAKALLQCNLYQLVDYDYFIDSAASGGTA